MLEVEAAVGLIQLGKYSEIVRQRQDTAQYYHEQLGGSKAWKPPLLIEGATYSQVVAQSVDRSLLINALRNHGVQLGQLIDYGVPLLEAYRPYAHGKYPQTEHALKHVVNLPPFAGMGEPQRTKVVMAIKRVARNWSE